MLLVGGLAREGNAKNNTLELLDGSYINMGVENIYNLKLNGAAYAIGGLAIFGDAIGNSLLAQKGSKVDIHTASFYRDMVGEFILDERITHLVGGLTYNGKVEKINLILMGWNSTSMLQAVCILLLLLFISRELLLMGMVKKLMMQPKTPLL
ncbi:hypothetical protein ACXG0V_000017 [Campylobacter coli]